MPPLVPVVSPYSWADLAGKNPIRTVDDNTAAVYAALVANGFSNVTSFAPESTPAMLLEVEADATTNFQWGQREIVNSKNNSTAQGAALEEHSFQIYNQRPLPGQQAIGRLLLTDGGSGPWQITPSNMSFSIGLGGLLYDGINDPTGAITTPITLPKNGTCLVYVKAAATGGAYNAIVGSINTIARGGLPNVTVTNPSGWQAVPGGLTGSDVEKDPALRIRNSSKWGTLGTGSPQSAYVNWARSVSSAITRAKPFTNLDMLDAGVLTLIIAGASGALDPGTVLAVQNAIAPAQFGGPRIPETARFTCAAAVNNTVAIQANLYVPGELNSVAFQNLVFANILAYQQALDIGAKISWGRLEEVTTEIAGLDAGTIVDVDWLAPLADIQQQFQQVAVFDVSGIKFISV